MYRWPLITELLQDCLHEVIIDIITCYLGYENRVLSLLGANVTLFIVIKEEKACHFTSADLEIEITLLTEDTMFMDLKFFDRRSGQRTHIWGSRVHESFTETLKSALGYICPCRITAFSLEIQKVCDIAENKRSIIQ
jgi:hypothetical protein